MIGEEIKPAFFVDPLTSHAFLQELNNSGYRVEPGETELWRVFDLSTTIPEEDDILRIDSKTITFLPINIDKDTDALKQFLHINQTTNEIDDETMEQIRRNLAQKRREDAKIIPIVAYVNGEPAACICLGMSGGIGNLSEGGTLKAHRGKSIFPWMRIKCLRIAEEHGCDFVMSNTLASNAASHRGSDKSGFIRGFYRHLWIK
jgi:hypothetical protein